MEIFLSSSKKGYGVRELMNSLETDYWNSDDVLPHSISIVFPKFTYVYNILLLLSYNLDESYTPEKILVYYNDECRTYNFNEPEGFIALAIDRHVLEIHIVIANNHSEGKDSHIRQMKVMKSPTEQILYDLEKFM